ncbi:hypothetical protein QUA08_30750, partial [Microcoleus sp. T3B2]|uniref:hypothetical protein n=1 Tax=Microcoleus sp. T3B2 TaxID=3055426 RepID=UPI002FD632BC
RPFWTGGTPIPQEPSRIVSYLILIPYSLRLTQKPGFLRQYFVSTERFSKNPVSLVEVRNRIDSFY